MFGTFYNHHQIRRFLLAFGSFFDKLEVRRTDAAGKEIQRLVVPIEYADKERWFSRLASDPEFLRGVSGVSPRMAYNITSIAYDPARKLNSLNNLSFLTTTTDLGNSLYRMYVGVPYTLTFDLHLLSKTQQDGLQVLEQILPYFTPDLTFTIQTIPELQVIDQVPLTLLSLSESDSFDGDMTHRRQIVWTLTFAMKVFFYGPVRNQRRIEQVQVDIFGDEYASDYRSVVLNSGGVLPIRYWRLGEATSVSPALCEIPAFTSNGHLISTTGSYSSGAQLSAPGALLYETNTALNVVDGKGVFLPNLDTNPGFGGTAGTEYNFPALYWAFELWFKPTQVVDHPQALFSYKTAVSSGLQKVITCYADTAVAFGGTGKFVMLNEDPNTATSQTLSSVTEWEVGKWYHLVFVSDEANIPYSWTIFVNGASDASLTSLSAASGVPWSNGRIGSSSTHADWVTQGVIDEVAIYNQYGVNYIDHYLEGRTVRRDDDNHWSNPLANAPKVIITTDGTVTPPATTITES
jgi:hypothetical protein